MSNRRAYDLEEARHLCARLASRCSSRHFRDHILACKRARDLTAAQRHLAAAFSIAAKEGAVSAEDWRVWKRDLARRRYHGKSLTAASTARQAEIPRYLKSILGGLATERFRIPPSVRGR